MTDIYHGLFYQKGILRDSMLFWNLCASALMILKHVSVFLNLRQSNIISLRFQPPSPASGEYSRLLQATGKDRPILTVCLLPSKTSLQHDNKPCQFLVAKKCTPVNAEVLNKVLINFCPNYGNSHNVPC
jgi:hypothetical protein